MPQTVKIPSYFNVRSMHNVISATIDEEHQPISDEINFDFSHLVFAEPDGMTVLSNLIEWLKKRGVKGEFINCDLTKPSIKYMDDCGFFKEYCGDALDPRADIRDTTQQFRKINCDESHAWIENVIPWCANILDTNLASLSEVKTCIREIFFNIRDHSTETIGCVHVQWFPRPNAIQFSITDFGVGIPSEIATAYAIQNDAQALALAVREGVSSKRNGRNRGAGLSYLIDNVVGRHGGSMALYSSKGKLIASKSSGRLTKTPSLNPFYPGTLFSIILNKASFVRADDAREDLQW